MRDDVSGEVAGDPRVIKKNSWKLRQTELQLF
jgi:hypothetical protein